MRSIESGDGTMPKQVCSSQNILTIWKIILSLFSVLSLGLPCQALAPIVPSDFVAPPCTSNSSLLPMTIRVEMGNCDQAGDCSPDTPLSNITISPAVSPVLLTLPDYEKDNPNDVVSARISFRLNSSQSMWPPELIYSYYDGVSQYTDDTWVGPQNYLDNSLYIWFNRNNMDSAPQGFSGFMETFSLLFIPAVWHVNVTQPGLQLSQSCSLVVQFKVNCCNSPQSMQLVAQPYWILLLSTVTYFLASYFYVYSMMALEQFPAWRRTVAQIKSGCCCRSHRKQPSPSSQPKEELLLESEPLSQSLLNPAAANSSTDEPVVRQAISSHGNTSHSEDAQASSTTDRLMHANAMFLILQFLIVIGNLVYLILRFTVLPRSSEEQQWQSWFKYEYIYQFWTNSTVATLLASSAASHLTLKFQLYETLKVKGELPEPNLDTTCQSACCCGCCCHRCRVVWAYFKVFVALNLPRERLICRHIVVGILILMSPAIATHVLPMAIFFFPFVLLAFLTMIIATILLYVVIRSTERKATSAFKTITSRQMKQIPDDSSDINAAATEQESEAITILKPQQQQVEFPWYSLLLFRVLCTLTVIIFVQTLFNYGIVVYDNVIKYDPNVESGFQDWANKFWLTPISQEFAQRNAQIYWQAIENDLYEKFRAVTLIL